MGRTKSYYHEVIGGELENVPAEYLLTPEEIWEIELDWINHKLRLAAELNTSELDIYSE